MSMGVLSPCMSVYHVHALLVGARRQCPSSGTGITDGYMCCGDNPGFVHGRQAS